MKTPERIKTGKKTSKCQSFGEFGTFYEKTMEKSLTMPKKTEREDHLRFFNIHSVANLRKN